MKYFRIYWYLIKVNFSLITAYRVNFINNVIGSLGWGAFSILIVVLLTSKTPVVFGWTRTEFLVLAGCVNIFLAMYRALFSRNFERFSRVMLTGDLDGILVKPIDSMFLLSLSYINFSGIFRFLLSSLFVYYLLVFELQKSLSLFTTITFFVFLVIGILILYSVWFLFLTLTIWYPDLSNLNALMYSIDGLIRYPREMYQKFSYILFIAIFPLTMVVVFPTKILLQKITAIELLPMIITALGMFFAARLFWQFALRSYTSASS